MHPITLPRRDADTSLPDRLETGGRGGADPTGSDFTSFVREHEPALVSFLCARIQVEDAKDIAQESLLRLMRYRNHPPAQLKPLMYRIALNTLNDHGRRLRTRHASLHDSLDDDAHGVASGELAHDQRLANEHELGRVRAAILQLPVRCRQVYLLNRIEGMSYPQIASHCAISVKSVEKHIGKALTMLRMRLRTVNALGQEQ